MTQSIALRPSGRRLSGYRHELQWGRRRRWRTIRSYAAMAWALAERPVCIFLNNVAGLAVIVTVCWLAWMVTP